MPESTLRGRTTCGVYALIDPRNDRVMYVGQSIDIEFRYKAHCRNNDNDRNFEKGAWINELRMARLKPELRILEECDWENMDEREIALIREYREAGECELNIANGGKGCVTSYAQRANFEEWYQLGRKVKALDLMILDCMASATPILGSKADMFYRFRENLFKIKSKLENELAKKTRDWPDESWMNFFYGN